MRHPTAQGPDAFTLAADLDSNGRLDLITYDGAGDLLHLHRNQVTSPRQGIFAFAPYAAEVDLGVLEGRRPALVYAEDFDFDGWNDLLVAADDAAWVFYNDNTGHFPTANAKVVDASLKQVARATFGKTADGTFAIRLGSASGEEVLYSSGPDRRLEPLSR